MKIIKKVLLLTTMLSMVFVMTLGPAAGAAKVNVAIDGKPIAIAASYGTPYIDSANRTMVPLRASVEAMGAKVAWDKITETATINGNIKIKVGSAVIETPYGKLTMDTKAVIVGDRTYIPFRFVGNALGYDVDWNAKTSTANIITKADLTISAAASLKNALDEIQVLYQKEKPNAKTTFTYAGSGTLEQQIQQGAPVDVFLSAATSNMNNLKNKGLVNNGSVKNLLRNVLVLITPSESKVEITSFADITNPSIKKLALGEPKTVPAGKYGEQALTFYKVIDAAKSKAVYAKDVTEVLTWVSTGNVDAGVVYSTDAKSSNKVKIVATASEDSHDPVVYPGAVIKASNQQVAAQDFLNYLSSKEAKAIFVKYGFKTL